MGLCCGQQKTPLSNEDFEYKLYKCDFIIEEDSKPMIIESINEDTAKFLRIANSLLSTNSNINVFYPWSIRKL